MNTNTDIASVTEVLRGAQRRHAARGETPNDVATWLIIAAAVFGALMLTRSLRRVSGMAFGLFWIWFWTHGAWRHLF